MHTRITPKRGTGHGQPSEVQFSQQGVDSCVKHSSRGAACAACQHQCNTSASPQHCACVRVPELDAAVCSASPRCQQVALGGTRHKAAGDQCSKRSRQRLLCGQYTKWDGQAVRLVKTCPPLEVHIAIGGELILRTLCCLLSISSTSGQCAHGVRHNPAALSTHCRSAPSLQSNALPGLHPLHTPGRGTTPAP